VSVCVAIGHMCVDAHGIDRRLVRPACIHVCAV
jgi:hypothetical protein